MHANQYPFQKTAYRHIFLIDDRNYWEECQVIFDANVDLVLTYDFSLKHQLEKENIEVHFLDHLVDSDTMQKNNFIIYDFFSKWHYDKNNNDILTYKEVPFGLALRLNFWSEYVSYIKLYISFATVETLAYTTLYVGTENKQLADILQKKSLVYKKVDLSEAKQESYYFPISKWMGEQLHPKGLRGLKYKLRDMVTDGFTQVSSLYDKVFSKRKRNIFIQEYHPTRSIVEYLKKDKTIQVVLPSMIKRQQIREYFSERYLPIVGNVEAYNDKALSYMNALHERKVHRLVLVGGSDITEEIYDLIFTQIKPHLPKTLQVLESSIQYLETHTLSLIILIGNLGFIPTLLDCVCKTRGIPSYLIINGLLGPEYSDEAKYATVINAYSQSIKDNYFRGMDNIVTLGDPRMDMYPESLKKKVINRDVPTIVIGASGFNPVDLNSYVAVEFDFMFDVLSTLVKLDNDGENINVIIKVRPNGYRQQYEDFVQEYFPMLQCVCLDVTPMKEVLLKSDLYISIYSQTLFEASCMGIPVIYYKKDTEIMAPPFDAKSELVTASNISELEKAFYDFKNEDIRYNDFLDRKIMEKYIGKLDGDNLKRNLNHIYQMSREKVYYV